MFYSMNDLLQLVYSEEGNGLRLHVGQPPVAVLREDIHHSVEGPPIATEEMAELLHSISDTRQRRELAGRGIVQFIYRFRNVMDVLVCARLKDEQVEIDIHRQAPPS
jgi:Tfp pilus assembly ATPase PilU